jgi:hypothetical protein
VKTRYRKRPLEIEAIRVIDTIYGFSVVPACGDQVDAAASAAWGDLPKWLQDAYERGDIIFGTDFVNIKTLEGSMRGDLGDWIICGIKGELYPCKHDIFVATYELVAESTSAAAAARSTKEA